MKSGRELIRAIGSAAFGSPATKCVPADEARCPPAEKPMIPILAGSIPHCFARERTCCTARCASSRDRKSTRLNSSHVAISYAVFCLKKKKKKQKEQVYTKIQHVSNK